MNHLTLFPPLPLDTRARPDIPLSTRVLSEAEWLALGPSWTSLLAASDCDALFCSPQWQHAWWRHFGRGPNTELHVVAAWRDQELIGLAPFYLRRGRRHGLLPVRSLQPVGAAWRESGGEISEYLDVICRIEERAAVRRAVQTALLSHPSWNELALPNTARFAEWQQDLAQGPHIACRIVDAWSSHQCELGAGFTDYLRTLGASTRRSLFHLRRRLARGGVVTLEHVEPGDRGAALAELNELHARRWQTPAYSSTALGFHRDVTELFGAAGQLRLSRLRVGGCVVSVLYDLRIARRQYNLQMGFDPSLAPDTSLGLLHLGFQMERAAAEGVTTYDLLAGRGRTSDYKPRLASRQVRMATVHAMRGRVRSRLLRAYGALHG